MIAGGQVVDQQGQFIRRSDWIRLHFARISSKTSGFFLCGMMLLPVVSSEGKEMKPKVLVDIETAIHRQPAEGGGYGSQPHGNDLFRLATAHLRIHGVVIQGAEVQQAGSQLPVQGKGRAITGTTA